MSFPSFPSRWRPRGAGDGVEGWGALRCCGRCCCCCGLERESRPGVRVGWTTTAGGADGWRRWWKTFCGGPRGKPGCFWTSIMVVERQREDRVCGFGEKTAAQGTLQDPPPLLTHVVFRWREHVRAPIHSHRTTTPLYRPLYSRTSDCNARQCNPRTPLCHPTYALDGHLPAAVVATR